MKKIIAFITMLMLIPLAYAGNGDTYKGDKKMDSQYKELNLTDQQKDQIREIKDRHMKAKSDEVRSVLTPEQQEKYDKLKGRKKDNDVENKKHGSPKTH